MAAFLVVGGLVFGCGKAGPPLPPLVKLPAPPTDFTANRRGDQVDLRFTIPAANMDNSRPANIKRVDVYALTSRVDATDAELLKYGTRVGSVDVKAPKDPNDTTTPGEDEEVEEPTGNGLDQGAPAEVEDTISQGALTPVSPVRKQKGRHEERGPLLGLSAVPPSRTYVSVGISTHDRRGRVSKRVVIPLVAAPPAPAAPKVTYTESAITVAWTPRQGAAAIDVLPSHPLGEVPPTTGYYVYEAGAPAAAPATPPSGAPATAPARVGNRLTASPVAAPPYTDNRMTWGTRRCYAVREVETIGGAAIESAPSPETCVDLADTFPPVAPKQLSAVASEGAISLIWDPNTEPDLAGYLVLRGSSPDALTPVTPKPIAETTYKDTVTAGAHYYYAVEAVDKAGNASPRSNTVEETAR